jgi:4-amino-4-deoxy-L-arabinose transferase-like glycosyltransferase
MGRGRSRVAWSLVLPVAAAELLLLVAAANRYGYHRDELYFRVAARHPAWGYDDQPALTPLLGRFSEWMFGADPRGLRIVSAVAIALVVVFVALIARELGAGHAGQAVAALATAASGAAMAVGHLLSTTTFDVLLWVTLVYLVARILGGGDERQWLLVGLVAGIGLENKHLVLLLLLALACGCLLARRWDLARSPWLWVGTALAFALWLPNLLWQARHGWPQLELAAKIAEEEAAGNRVELLPLQLLLIGPLLAPLWLGGLWWLLRRAEARLYRPLGYAYLVLLAIALVTGAKSYYTMGLLLALVGAGGVVAESWLRDQRGRKLALGVTIALSAAVAALITLPLVPVGDVHATPIPDINEDAIETIGWPTFAATVGRVWNGLPQSERSTAVVYASNYGEAGAIARYGRVYGIPRAYSGHNAFWRFGRPPDGARPIIVVGYHHPETLRGDFRGCVLSARIDNGVAIDNEEQGAPIWTCARTAEAWSRLWPRLHSLTP